MLYYFFLNNVKHITCLSWHVKAYRRLRIYIFVLGEASACFIGFSIFWQKLKQVSTQNSAECWVIFCISALMIIILTKSNKSSIYVRITGEVLDFRLYCCHWMWQKLDMHFSLDSEFQWITWFGILGAGSVPKIYTN